MSNKFFLSVFISIFVSLYSFNIDARNIFGYESNLTFFGNAGITYNFPASTVSLFQYKEFYGLSVPISFGVNIQFIEYWSLFVETSFIYDLRGTKETINNDSFVIQNHNIFIDIPIMARFYPMAYKGPQYENFYISVGLLAHFWPGNFYYINKNNGTIISGNGYIDTAGGIMPDTAVYNPVNFGIKVVLGNAYTINDNFIIGVDIYSKFLFLPIINGYNTSPAYIDTITGVIPVDFYVNLGVSLSFGGRVKIND